jgi:uncharacterized protein (DUF4415 family)
VLNEGRHKLSPRRVEFWKKLRAMPDSEVAFTEDALSTAPEDWADAVAHRGLPLPPRKKQIALRVDDEVLAWFKKQGTGYALPTLRLGCNRSRAGLAAGFGFALKTDAGLRRVNMLPIVERAQATAKL